MEQIRNAQNPIEPNLADSRIETMFIYVYIYFLHFKIYNEIEELSRKAVCSTKNINMYLLIFTWKQNLITDPW